MKRLTAAGSLIALAIAAYFASTATAQGPTPVPSVWLQSSSPGVTQSGNMNMSGIAVAGLFQGGGAGLTGLNAGNITMGSLGDARLSTNVAFLSGSQTFTGPKAFSGGLDTTSFRLSTGGAVNRVLTSDASGNGTWQSSPGFNLPYTSSIDFAGHAMSITNTSLQSGTSAIRGESSSLQFDSAGVIGFNNSASGNGGLFSGTYGLRAYGSSVAAYCQGGVAVEANGTTYGVKAQVAIGGQAAVNAAATGGAPFAIRATQGSTSSYAIYAEALNTNSTAIGGKGGVVGVYGESYWGVRGVSPSPVGAAVTGYASSASGANVGVHGGTNSVDGAAVIGSTSQGVYGGYFENLRAGGGYGVFGIVTQDQFGTGYGVLGHNGVAGNYGVYSIGPFAATGAKAFRIDHPSDPLNKYLNHYCTEGPEPLNVYRGRVTTDANGFAWVELPDYFSEINKNPEYDLTVIDGSSDFVLAKVTREVENNRFLIRTSKPLATVSWRVEAVRNDLWVRKNGVPVEVEKQGRERGKYQHPELYGASEEMATFGRAPIRDMSANARK